ncbi:hypothetical protein BH23GEM3_BH23GEM3_25240 [soil metagenome]
MRERKGPVSWLEAASLAFPDLAGRLPHGVVQWLCAEEVTLRMSGPGRHRVDLHTLPGLLQWRGRAGFTPASEGPSRAMWRLS